MKSKGAVGLLLAVLFIGAAIGYAIVIGSARADSGRARDTALSFMDAGQNGDIDAERATMTSLARENFHPTSDNSGDRHNDGDGFTVGDPKMDKDGINASVPVAITKSDGQRTDGTILLRRESGAWRVYAMRLPFVPGGPMITMDFEHPDAVIGDVFRAAGEGIGAAMKGIGEGMGAMMKGLGEGVAAMDHASATHAR